MNNKKIEVLKRFIVLKTFSRIGIIVKDYIRNPPELIYVDMNDEDKMVIAKVLNLFGFTVHQRIVMSNKEIRYFYESMSLVIRKSDQLDFVIFMIDEKNLKSTSLIWRLN